MPKIAINWETTAVSFYKFVCKDPTILYSYVGHTTNFSKRKWGHKTSCNNPKDKAYNIPLYVFIRKNGSWSNWDMVQIHSQICKDSLEARQIEQELIEQQQFKLNSYKAFITEEERKIYGAEYYEQHKEQAAAYYEQHKEQAAKYGTEYYEQHKEQIAEYQSEYREQHKEQTAIKQAEWRKNNKEKIKIKNTKYYQKKKTEKELSLCI